MADEGPHDEPLSRQPGRPEPPRRVPTPSSPAGGRPISIEITPRHIRLIPGQTDTATVTIRYHGSVVDELTLRVGGDAAGWTRVAPDSLNIYPDTSAQATIQFAPPRASRPTAGLIALELAVASSSDPGAATTQQATIEIEPYDELTATADGSTSLIGTTEAVLPIKVRNLGNRAADVALAVSPTPAASVSLSTTTMTIEPGGEATVWTTVRPNPQPAGGAARLHPFTVSVSSRYSPPITIDARMEQAAAAPLPVAVKPRRVPMALLALLGAGVLVVVVAGVILMNGRGGATATPSGQTPTSGNQTPTLTTGTTAPPEETTAPPDTATPVQPEETTAPPDTATPVQPLSFGERAAGRWVTANVDAPLLDERGFPSDNYGAFMDVQLSDATTPAAVGWWFPTTETPEVLLCPGTFDGSTISTTRPGVDLGRMGELLATGELDMELLVAQLCGTSVDITPDLLLLTELAFGAWQVTLGGDPQQPATTLDMTIDAAVGDVRVITTINWIR